jgi:hypothetical protein
VKADRESVFRLTRRIGQINFETQTLILEVLEPAQREGSDDPDPEAGQWLVLGAAEPGSGGLMDHRRGDGWATQTGGGGISLGSAGGCCWSRRCHRRCRRPRTWGLVSPTAAREVARLPRGIQQTVARIIARQGMSTRAAAKLVAATEQLQPATAEEIERLCRSAQAQAPARSGPRSDAEAYTADLALLERMATPLQGRLLDRPPARLPPPHGQEIAGQLRAALPVLCTLLDTMTATLEGP